MKSIVTALFLLISSGAVAQTAKPALPEITVAEPQPTQVKPMTTSGSNDYSSSTMTVVAANLIPSAPLPAISVALVRPVAAVSQRPSTEFKPFSSNKVNRTLVATEFWTRGLDAFSTHEDLNNLCNCYHESSRFLGLNMTPMVKTTLGAYSYSLGVAATYSIVSAKLWNASKNHPNHARLLRILSRALLVGDSSMEINADVRNFTITNSAPLNPKTLPVD
jgi:hypothetical protein